MPEIDAICNLVLKTLGKELTILERLAGCQYLLRVRSEQETVSILISCQAKA